MRDDFSKDTKNKIARRQGYLCAICGCVTAGPTRDPSGFVNIGTAAHITAASAGGPRYDLSLTPKQRSSVDNGIWCCRNHGKEVDDDKNAYTVERLRTLKRSAEERATNMLGVRAEYGPDLLEAENIVRAVTQKALEKWRATYAVDQGQLAELDLRPRPADPEQATVGEDWSLSRVTQAVSSGAAVLLVGGPGAGKTITLIQIAEALVQNASAPAPILLLASDWVASGQDLPQYVATRLDHAGVPRSGVSLLLKMSRLAFLINGWNEAAEDGQTRADAQIRGFLLTHPGTPLVITARDKHYLLSFPGSRLFDIRPLSPQKKKAIVSGAGLTNPEGFLAQLDQDAALATLTDTPLFLAGAIRLARAGKAIPSTRSRLLRSFVADLEWTDSHGTMLDGEACKGYQREYLASIAVAMTKRACTVLPNDATRDVLAAQSRKLVSGCHIGTPGDSAAIADNLVRHHVLVTGPGADAGYRFVHQQFQEWFAAQWLQSEVRRLGVSPDATELFEFQRDVLNFPQWQEALQLAVEGLADSDEATLAAQIVRWMMPVDLIAAAELSNAGGPTVWGLVGRELGADLLAWHGRVADPHRKCALMAMLATGAPDFADLVSNWGQTLSFVTYLASVSRLHSASAVAAGTAVNFILWGDVSPPPGGSGLFLILDPRSHDRGYHCTARGGLRTRIGTKYAIGKWNRADATPPASLAVAMCRGDSVGTEQIGERRLGRGGGGRSRRRPSGVHSPGRLRALGSILTAASGSKRPVAASQNPPRSVVVPPQKLRVFAFHVVPEHALEAVV